MKLRTAVAGLLIMVIAAGGIGLGVKHFLKKSSSTVVDVVPVSNANIGDLGDNQIIYGNVTSRVAQNVALNTEYKLGKVFVKEGDSIQEGDILFEYDMTLQELQLEIKRLTWQTEELKLKKLEKELEKLKGSSAQASLVPVKTVMTTAAPVSFSEGDNETLPVLETQELKSELQTESQPEIIIEPDQAINDETGDQMGNNGGNGKVSESDGEKKPQGTETTEGNTETESKPETEGSTETEGIRETEGSTETESGRETEGDTETESGRETEGSTETENVRETEVDTETESGRETEGNTETESERETEGNTETESSGETESERESESESESENESESGEENEELEHLIQEFLAMAKAVLSDEAINSSEYLVNMEKAIEFFQNKIGDVADDKEQTLEGQTDDVGITMEDYRIRREVKEYLINKKEEELSEKIEESYKKICLNYMLYQMDGLDAKALVREKLQKAMETYRNLGSNWQVEAEVTWTIQKRMQRQEDVTQIIPGMFDTLKAYDVILSIQELDTKMDEDLLKSLLISLKEYYLALSEEAKELVWNAETLIDLLKKYDLWDDTPDAPGDFDFPGDFGGADPGYSAEELKNLISDKEQEIRAQKLSVQEAELEVKKYERIVNEKTVKSAIDGTVISVGSSDGSSEDEYFLKVTNKEGLYVRGVMNEFALESMKVGDTISGSMLDSGMEFTAVIKEISKNPGSNDSDIIVFGLENSNTSYYPFYALIDDSEGLDEGEAQIQLDGSVREGVIYLPQYFICKDEKGEKYVMKQGEDGLLETQYIKTGRSYSSYVEILEGLNEDDKIAFPFGKNIRNGAKTREVENLE